MPKFKVLQVKRDKSQSTREVYIVGDKYVLKRGLDDYGEAQNIAEAYQWRALSKSPDRDSFMPVISYDPNGDWLIQRKADKVVRRDPGDKLRNALLPVAQRYGVRDVWAGNFGYHQDRLVVFDYGINKKYY